MWLAGYGKRTVTRRAITLAVALRMDFDDARMQALQAAAQRLGDLDARPPAAVWPPAGLDAGGCAVGFREGDSYLVYAVRGGDGVLRTSYCMRTRHLSEVAEDLRVLGALPPADHCRAASTCTRRSWKGEKHSLGAAPRRRTGFELY